MSALKVTATVLVVAGALVLLFGSFSYVKAIHRGELGPFEVAVKERQTVNVPIWAGVGLVLAGGLMFVPRRRG
jgi:hypothetical protein